MDDLNQRHIELNYKLIQDRYPSFKFAIFISELSRYGILYSHTSPYETIVDTELFSLFLLEHSDVVKFVDTP